MPRRLCVTHNKTTGSFTLSMKPFKVTGTDPKRLQSLLEGFADQMLEFCMLFEQEFKDLEPEPEHEQEERTIEDNPNGDGF